MVDLLVRLNSFINAKHAMYQKCQRKKHFLSRSITCRIAGITLPGFETGFCMHQYFKKKFDLVPKFKVALGSFLGQGEN